jgi:hypothetical protein
LLDNLSADIILIVFSALVCGGQLLFAYGVSMKHFYVMLLGRFFFGLGAESLDVAQAQITTKYFQSRGLAFALGVNLSIARIAAGINDNLSPYLAGAYSTPVPIWLGVVVTYALNLRFAA